MTAPPAECIHDLVPASCSVCSGRDREAAMSERPDPAGFGPWISARRHGKCAGCGEAVKPEDHIRSDGAGGWLCLACGTPEGAP